MNCFSVRALRYIHFLLSGITTMCNESTIETIIEIVDTFNDFDTQFILFALNKCHIYFKHEYSLKNDLFYVDGIFNYVLTYSPINYVHDHLITLCDKQLIKIESQFKSVLNNFYQKHHYLLDV